MKHAKRFATAIAVMAAIGFVVPASAADTQQFGKDVVVTAAKTDGNVTVSWTDPLKVLRVEHYIGHGSQAGFVAKLAVGDAKQVVLKDVAKNGARFNLVTSEGKFLHLECGGNPATTMPTFKGLKVDCSFILNGERVGALVAE